MVPRRLSTTLHAYRCPTFRRVYRVCRCESRAWQRRAEVDRRHRDNQRPAPRSPPTTTTTVCSADDTALVRRLWSGCGGGGRGGSSRDNRPPSSSGAAPPEEGRSGAQGRDVVGRTRRYVGIYKKYLPAHPAPSIAGLFETSSVVVCVCMSLAQLMAYVWRGKTDRVVCGDTRCQRWTRRETECLMFMYIQQQEQVLNSHSHTNSPPKTPHVEWLTTDRGLYATAVLLLHRGVMLGPTSSVFSYLTAVHLLFPPSFT